MKRKLIAWLFATVILIAVLAIAAQTALAGPAPLSVLLEVSSDGINWQHPTDPTAAPHLKYYHDVYWRQTVTNTGDMTLTNVEVRDNYGSGMTILSLAPGESTDSSHIIQAKDGLDSNTATATGQYGDTTVTASDTAYYFGDSTFPMTTLIPDTPGNDGWYNHDVVITLVASDPDDDASTLQTDYVLDGIGYHYTGPFTVSGEGAHTLDYFSGDPVGNWEPLKTWTCTIDITPPQIEGTNPGNGDTNVLTGYIYGAWNEDMKSSEGAEIYVFVDGHSVDLDSGFLDNRMFEIALFDQLPAGKVVTVTISDAMDLAGNVQYPNPYIWTFTTLGTDTTLPSTELIVDNTGTGYYTGDVLVTLVPSDLDDDASTLKTYYTLDGAVETLYMGPFYVSGDGSHTLEYHSVDPAGNAGSVQIWTCKIDTIPPHIDSIYPVDGAKDVPVDAAITTTWSELLGGLSVDITDEDGNVIVWECRPNYLDTSSATIYPFSGEWPAGKVITVTVEAMDYARNMYDYTWSFTTASPDTTPPTIESKYPADGDKDVPVDVTITGTWSEDIEITDFNALYTISVDGDIIEERIVTMYPRTFTIVPWDPLPAGKVVTVKVSDAVDLAGNLQDPNPYTWSFTTFSPDTTPPMTTVSWMGGPGDNGWYTTDVTVTLSATDAGGSGLASTLYKVVEALMDPDTVEWKTYTGPFTISDGKNILWFYSTDNAGNAEEMWTESINVDTVAPTVLINSPLAQVYLLNEPVLADYVVNDGPLNAQWTYSGIASVTPTVEKGQPIDTGTPGTYTYTVTAKDNAGNTDTETVTYTMGYAYTPVTPSSTKVTQMKLGSTLPVKAVLKDSGGNRITDAVVRLYLAKQSGSGWGPEIPATSMSNPKEGNLFRYDPLTGQYVYNLNTKPLSMGTWELRIRAGDGLTQTSTIKIVK